MSDHQEVHNEQSHDKGGTIVMDSQSMETLLDMSPNEEESSPEIVSGSLKSETIPRQMALPILRGLPIQLSNEISKLLSPHQLSEVAKLFQSHDIFSKTRISKWSFSEGPFLLRMIPIELRYRIWKQLLVNPDLGEASSVTEKENRGAKTKYGLTPAILRVCKQTNVEGMEVLYRENTFVVCDSISHDYQILRSACPLTRYEQVEHQSKIFTYVRNWRVILRTENFNNWDSPEVIHGLSHALSILKFCRIICQSSPKSLELLLVPRKISYFPMNRHDLQADLEFALKPFSILRNIEHFTIRPAQLDEIPKDAIFKNSKMRFYPTLPDPEHMSSLINLVRGNSEVELMHEMYQSLLQYSQGFERVPEFKEDMAEYGSSFQTRFDFNPFLGDFGRAHPVEQGLYEARKALTGDNMMAFQACRSAILLYLEPQYQKIEQASHNLAQFMKEEKRSDGILNSHSPSFVLGRGLGANEMKATQAIILLEDYSTSFNRQLDASTKLEIRRQKNYYAADFESLYRESLMRHITAAFENHWWDRFWELYKQVVDDMDSQYLEIRAARKKLYGFDLKSTPRIIDIKPNLCDEKIDWDKVEPDFDVKTSFESPYKEQSGNYIDNSSSEDSSSEDSSSEDSSSDDSSTINDSSIDDPSGENLSSDNSSSG
ncbi:hypothetical protein NHQ30_005467 [Ciborinia camelliae]|nr:hypothetical protein NHQ30_005467 [Ciborinia camelliae]